MPKVEQYDWSKLKPAILKTRQTHGTTDFPVNKLIEARKNNSKHGDIKVKKLPDPYKCSKCTFVGNVRKELDDHWLLDH